MRDLLDVFPREQVHWIFFDDLKANPGREYRRTLAFLGLPDDRRDIFQKVNQNAVVQPGPLLRLLKGDRLLRRINMSSAMRAELRDFFRQDILLVEELTGRDLSAWRIEP